MVKCKAITASGKRCTREATSGDNCWQHAKQTSRKPKTSAKRRAPARRKPKKTVTKKSKAPTADQKQAWLDWLEIVSEELADYGVDFEELEDITERQAVWALSTAGASGKAKAILNKIAAAPEVGRDAVVALKKLRSEIQSVDRKYLPFPYDAVEWRR